MSASILVVDDEEAIVSSLGSILQDEGYEVAVAKSGVEALKIYTVDPPDLMLLDIWMPEMDRSGHGDVRPWLHRNGGQGDQAGGL
jgi:two-component system nitrogen regulation response regulator NtrX